MSVESAFRAHLLNNAGVAALVGARVYFECGPPAPVSPYIVVRKLDYSNASHMTNVTDLSRADLAVACWSTDSTVAKTVAEAVRLSIVAHHVGTLGSGGETVASRSVMMQSQTSGFSDPQDAGDLGYHVIVQNWRIWFVESVPV